MLPDGEAVPPDGGLPAGALAGLGSSGFGIYIHIPFCASRCGYCDFNTYTAAELGGGGAQRDYAENVLAEVALAAKVLGPTPPVETVFFGGGTPTLLPADDLGRILAGVRDAFGLTGDAEVTTEANPETVDPDYLGRLRRHGFTRISLGMQSTAPHVLAQLERRHTPGRAGTAAREAREAGFRHVNLDLIYGTPGEHPEDFAASLDAAVAAGVDHISAYSLIVEDGTRFAARVRRGEIAMPDDDVAAERYLVADELLTRAGFGWYEVSNWARTDADRCRHNLIYWRGGDWWGFGPGAHSHVGGVRWWNVKHPSTYARRLADGVSPGHGREVLTPDDQRVEKIMLALRLAEGLELSALAEPARRAARRHRDEGLLNAERFDAGRLVLTLRGRLLADAIIRDLV